MSQNVGQIDLDLVLNGGNLRNQVTNLAGFAAKTFAAVFAVKQIVGFTKSCIELGSNLAEVQNVVDVTFGSMSQQINDFASTAIEQFGLSETSAKKYASTMGAILKSSGITGQAMTEMSKKVTSLSADLASFYNIDSDFAFEKIRSGLTGEIEPLRQLGINMSVANLEAYALSQGITKAYKNMSQAEQTLLRYNYLLSVTGDAQGDFARTSDSWANQTRILSEQFNALKATLGQSFITILAPVVKWLNALILKLQQAANAFKSFVETIFGKKSESSGLGSVAGDLGSITDGATSAGDAIGGIGDSAASAAKELKGLMGFDEINSLTKTDSSGSDAGVVPEIGGATDLTNAMDNLNTKTNEFFDNFMNRMQELKELFMEGFKIGFGDTNFDGITKALDGIKQSVKEIFTDPEVINASKKFADSIALNLGKVVGSIASIGVTIAENLLGGFDKYLDKSKQYIKDRLVGIFNVGAEIANMVGDFAAALADIFSIFRSNEAKQLTADIIGIFANAFLGATELSLKFGRDLIKCILNPIIENKNAIKKTFLNIIKTLESIFGGIKNMIDKSFEGMLLVYDKYFKPAFDRIEHGISNLLKTILDVFNNNLAPAFQYVAGLIGNLFENKLGPLFVKIFETLGKLGETVAVLWNSVISPVISEIISYVGPALGDLVQAIGESVTWLATLVSDVLSAILDVIQLGLDLIIGLIEPWNLMLQGDWSGAWNSLCDISSRVFEDICNLVKDFIVFIVDFFCPNVHDSITYVNDMFTNMGNWIDDKMKFIQKTLLIVWDSIKEITTSTWNSLKSFLSSIWSGISLSASTIWNSIKQLFDSVLNAIKTSFTNIWNNIKGSLSSIWSSISSLASSTWNGMKSTCISIFTGLSSSISSIWNGIKNVFSEVLSFITSTFQTGWKNAWQSVSDTFSNIFNGLSGIVKKPLNAIIGMVNSVIKGMNKLNIDIPDWVPKFGGESFGIHIPTIPALAKGGIVDAPTLAMVGEAGKEAVMPLENNTGWISQLAGQIAGQLGGLGNNNNSSSGDLNIELKVGEDKLGEIVIRQFRKLERKTGKAILNI